MSAGPAKTSRYRRLRGKSVSDVRRATVHFFNDQVDGSPSTLRSALTPPVWRRQSKILELGDTTIAPEANNHYPLPPIPKTRSQWDSVRPRAAVMPSGPAFAEPVTPTPLRARHSTQALTSVYSPPPYSTENLEDTCSEADQHRTRETAEKNELSEDPGLEGHPALLPDRLDADTDKILAEQKRLDISKLHNQLIATESRVSVASSSTLRTPSKSPVFERFGFFHRAKSQVFISPTSSTTTFVDFASRGQSTDPSSSPITPWQSKMQMTPPTSPLSPPYKPDNYVTVRYRSEHINIRITADTDTVDVLRQASEEMKLPVAPAASNLHECCSHHGIERRLRRYERIQEVLNSWPQNGQNSLEIRHACGPYVDKDLDISFVPLSKTPPAFTLELHHCSRPGKWHKRWVTLLCDGQVLSSKKAADLSPAEKDCQILCDLSCCDVYTPMDEPAILLDEGRSSKSSRASPVQSLKPPKRWVFAVKSQHRPTTVHENANYVHYFCTDDPAIANKFQTSVHVWRSWYMVKTRGDAQRKRDSDVEMASPTPTASIEEVPMKSTIPVELPSDHVLKISLEEFEPLINLEQEMDEFSKNWVPELPLILPPMTPGTDSDALMMTPSTSGGSGPGEDNLDLSSPSEQRRKRRDLQRSLTSTGTGEEQHGPADGSASATIIITEPQTPQTPLRSPHLTAGNVASTLSPAKPEPAPWLPSAAEHTAKLRAEHARRGTPPVTPQRPATSTGILRGGGGSRDPICMGPLNVDRRPVVRFGNTTNNNNDIGLQQPQPQPPLPHVTSYLDWVSPPPPVPARAPGSGIYFNLMPPRSASSRHLEVPTVTTAGGGKRRNLMTMPSMPALIESGSPKRQQQQQQRGAPSLWRDGDSSHENSSNNSGGRLSTSSNGRPSTSSNGSGGSGGGSDAGAARHLHRGRSGSMTSLRRGGGGGGGGGIGSARAFMGETPPPPIPPLPLHVRPAIRDGTGVRPLGMVMVSDARRRA